MKLKKQNEKATPLGKRLSKRVAEAHDQHSAEVEYLKQRLAEAEAKAQRAISQRSSLSRVTCTLFPTLDRSEKECSKLE